MDIDLVEALVTDLRKGAGNSVPDEAWQVIKQEMIEADDWQSLSGTSGMIVADILRKHGKHDQSSHGRKGGGASSGGQESSGPKNTTRYGADGSVLKPDGTPIFTRRQLRENDRKIQQERQAGTYPPKPPTATNRTRYVAGRATKPDGTRLDGKKWPKSVQDERRRAGLEPLPDPK